LHAIFSFLDRFFAAIILRLQGPSSENGTGLVEVYYKNQWGAICAFSWDVRDAEVACRQLGYEYAIKAVTHHSVPEGTGVIWLSFLHCNGYEQTLASCNHDGWGDHLCGLYVYAGVECSLTGMTTFTI
jgi:hypothetical protein